MNGVSTTYILDTATPLTIVLAETTASVTTRYWHGLDTLAQSDGTSVEYIAYDGLGSVRQLVDTSGSVGLAQTFDPYGNGYAKAGSAQSTLGYSGEQTDSNGFVYLRARYYQPGMGRFFQMDPSRQERNPYHYSYSNPLNYTDPSGHLAGDWNFNWSLVRQIKSEIITAARFHARPSDGFEWETTAVLMAAHIAREQRQSLAWWNQLGDWLYEQGKNDEASTGYANMRPEVVRNIFEEKIPLRLREEFQGLLGDDCLIQNTSANNRKIHSLLQQTDITLDVLGANIVRGIQRAGALGLKPSIFNVGNWLWNGRQNPQIFWEYIAGYRFVDGSITDAVTFTNQQRGLYEHGFVMVEQFPRAAQELGIAPSNYTLYNRLPNDPKRDEAVFVECEVNRCRLGGGKWAPRQNPECGKELMTPEEFNQQYRKYLQAFGLAGFQILAKE